jgi:palmitoyltransferase ZDHHC9/14/18
MGIGMDEGEFTTDDDSPFEGINESVKVIGKHGRVVTLKERIRESEAEQPATSYAGRLYQYWPGNNTFCFEGKVFLGGDSQNTIVTVSFLLVPAILYLVFGAWYPVSRLIFYSPIFFPFGLIYVFFGLLLAAVALYFLYLTAYSDPGVLPRASSSKTRAKTRRPRYIETGDLRLRCNYCVTCRIYRPPRASHCGICNNCVDEFDHHCPWMGNCIGKNNYKAFVSFLAVASLTSFVVMVGGLIHVATAAYEAYYLHSAGYLSGNGEMTWFVGTALVPGLCIFFYALVMFFSPLAMFSIHAYLISYGETTRECNNDAWSVGGNPFSMGFIKNWQIFCMRELVVQPLINRLQYVNQSKWPFRKLALRADLLPPSAVDREETRSTFDDRVDETSSYTDMIV